LAAIPAGSKNKDLAFEFIYWATTAEKQKELALKWGNPPTRKSVFTDTGLLAKDEYRHYPVLLQAISNSTPRPRIANWNEVENSFGIYLSQAVAGTISTKEALQTAQGEVEKLMQKAGYIK
jgi:multiple sugar transport system substrate-binding protein